MKAVNYYCDSAYTAEAGTNTLSTDASIPLTNLKLWLKADAGIAQQNTNRTVAIWLDQSGSTMLLAEQKMFLPENGFALAWKPLGEPAFQFRSARFL